MSEVRKHKRQMASGKTTTVRHHTRKGGSGENAGGREFEANPDYRPPHVSEIPAQETGEADESWWADDEPEPGEAAPPRRGDTAFPKMQEEMRAWRSRPEPVASPDEPMHPQLAKALGCDTPEGLAHYERGRAYREAGYDGPLDSDNRIPDPDDPAEYESLHTLAAMSE